MTQACLTASVALDYAMLTPLPLKTCRVCGEEKARALFFPKGAVCRACYAEEKRRIRQDSPPPPKDGTGTCSQCGETMPLAAFFPDRAVPGGYRKRCRECSRADRIALKRQARRRNGALPREELLRTQREAAESRKAVRRRVWEERQAHPLNQLRRLLFALFEARCAQQGRRPEAVEYKARWDRDPAFRERERQRQQRFKHANPHIAARWGERRKQQAAATSDGTLTHDVLRALFDEADLCPYCAVQMEAGDKTLDHREPLSLGGAHSVSNVLVCCRRCNIEKRDTPWAEWLGVVASRASLPPRVGVTRVPVEGEPCGVRQPRSSRIHTPSPGALSLSTRS
jgi:5-methylcytosine-specific restriction endonuclease McrA